jgi:hypothetical protein
MLDDARRRTTTLDDARRRTMTDDDARAWPMANDDSVATMLRDFEWGRIRGGRSM